MPTPAVSTSTLVYIRERDRSGNFVCAQRSKMYFSCQYCAKTFTNQGNMQVHQRVHTGERPYSCIGCGKCYAQKIGLKIHMDQCQAFLERSMSESPINVDTDSDCSEETVRKIEYPVPNIYKGSFFIGRNTKSNYRLFSVSYKHHSQLQSYDSARDGNQAASFQGHLFWFGVCTKRSNSFFVPGSRGY